MSKNKGKQSTNQYNNRYTKGTKPSASSAVTPKKTVPTQKTEAAQKKQPIDFSQSVTLSFQATDTLFFRESRPMEALGEAKSVFPPPMRTLAGAVRSWIGEHFQVEWSEFSQQQGEHPLAAYIGYDEALGKLRFQGAWLAWEGERLYPAPLHLLKKDQKLFPLHLSTATTCCDLGDAVRLPELPEGDNYRGGKPLENVWVTRIGLEAILAGDMSPKEQMKITEDLFEAEDLFEKESRLGIARDNDTRSVQKGLLYQTQHIRPKAGLSIEVDVHGLPQLPTAATLRLGGEGRMVHLEVKTAKTSLAPSPVKNQINLMLYLLTPLYGDTVLGFHCKKTWGEVRQTVWQGSLNGIALTLQGAVTGKVQRVGGWDAAANKPRPVKSLVPAGSVFFCTLDNGTDIQAAIAALHNQHIGEFTEYGYGHLAVGIWNDSKE